MLCAHQQVTFLWTLTQKNIQQLSCITDLMKLKTEKHTTEPDLFNVIYFKTAYYIETHFKQKSLYLIFFYTVGVLFCTNSLRFLNVTHFYIYVLCGRNEFGWFNFICANHVVDVGLLSEALQSQLLRLYTVIVI